MIPLKGTSTTTTGIISIIGGAFGLFLHVWGAIHGAPLDPTTALTSVGTIVAGAGLVKAADANQK